METARKRGGIKIVRPEWFNDSIALWQRQDETPYLFYDSPTTATSTSPLISDHQISSDPEPDADDWDLDPADLKAQIGEGEGGNKSGDALHLEEINWNDINDEVEAAMMESDDESVDDKSERGARSEDEFTDEASASRYVIQSFLPPSPIGYSFPYSRNNTPRMKRKRMRSLTPSETKNGDDSLRSPLAKRKKFAADRNSRLKQGITADELLSTNGKETREPPDVSSSALFAGAVNGDTPEGEDEEDDEGDLEDDFLARDLQEDWG